MLIPEQVAQIAAFLGSIASIASALLAYKSSASSNGQIKPPIWPYSFFPLFAYICLIPAGYLPGNENSIVFKIKINVQSDLDITVGFVFIFSGLAFLYADMVKAWAYSRKNRENRTFMMFGKGLIGLVTAIFVFYLTPWAGSSVVV